MKKPKGETIFKYALLSIVLAMFIWLSYLSFYQYIIRPQMVDAYKVSLEDRELQVVDARMNSPIVTVFLSEEEFLAKAAALNVTTIYFVSRGDFYIIDNGVGYLHIVG